MNIYSSLADIFFLSQSEIEAYLVRAPYRYKVYEIPKRNGKGNRVIAQPAKELKVFQKIALQKHLSNLPVHDSAMAYVEGVGIKMNAMKHSSGQYLLKMDFADFFPSITSNDLLLHIKTHYGHIVKADSEAIERLFFWKQKKIKGRRLSIGAPSSPFISNTILYEFDCLVSEYCIQRDITYTRYADDLTFTTNIPNILVDLPQQIASFLVNIQYPKLSLNRSKTVFSSKKHNRHVTGLVITNENKVSLGRERKRYIRSLLFKFSKDELEKTQILKLKGLIGFSKHIEPSFYSSLIKKYGLDILRVLDCWNA